MTRDHTPKDKYYHCGLAHDSYDGIRFVSRIFGHKQGALGIPLHILPDRKQRNIKPYFTYPLNIQIRKATGIP